MLQRRQPFLASGKFVARKTFSIQGKEFIRGDDFPFEELGISSRKLQTMFNAGFIMHNESVAEPKQTKIDSTKKAVKEVKAKEAKTTEKPKAVDPKEAKRQRAADRRAARKAA